MKQEKDDQKAPSPNRRVKTIKRDENRGKWSSKTEFILTLMGYAIGIGNVWRFPYLCYRSGGGTGCTGMFRLVPILKGTGICMVIVNMYCVCYYSVLLSYPVRMIYYCFWKTVPWIDCDHPWNTPNCTSLDKVQNDYEGRFTTSADEFFHLEVLRISESINHLGGMVWEQLLSLSISWIIICLCVLKGVKSVGKVAYFTALFPYVLLTILFVRGVTLPGAATGIKFFLYPEWHRLLDLKVWADAAIQMFFGLGPGWGGIVNMASFNSFRNNAKFDSILVVSINVFTSIYAGIVVFSVLGFLSFKSGIPVATVATSGAGLAFVTYPEAIALLPVPQLWALMFFIMLFLLGIDSVFVQLEAICSSLLDEVVYLRKHKMMVIISLCSIFFCAATIMCTNAGMYILQLFDWYSSAIAIIVICLIETIMVSYIYGIDNFMSDVEFMLYERPAIYWKIAWKYISPVVLTFILFTSIIFMRTITYNDVKYPYWAVLLGWFSFVSSVMFIPIYVFYIMIRKRETMCDSLKKRLKPLDWTPADPEDRADYIEYRKQRSMPALMSETEAEPEGLK
ncbi:sodium- and chloride-dependent glycine transporter 1 isoform X2 [Drosophila grimshawi]|uniref:sodium- and chloride-dependent glycine transporter 1 isoform X2 n=1 Tax=Drosophila grimshawi TaxID=7222 RepID=UPI000C86E893|nr:sodium- and chloride-dependent glycine transporter 1 isoform X2 [Drosophila grimshawi]